MTTVAITDYASLKTGINDFDENVYDDGQLDRFIGLSEGEFRLYFGPNYAKEASTTLTFTSGSASLPSGFIRCVAMTHSTYGTLTETSIGKVRDRRLYTSGIPARFAITGSTVELDITGSDSATMDYEGTLVGLSSGNTTNWLITNAPQAYLSMCLYFVKAFKEDPNALTYKQSALQTLSDLGFQSMVAQLSRAAPRIPGSTP
jgi:hypothetical protein